MRAAKGGGGRGGGCFPAGTMISTGAGVIDIAAAKEGDLVLTFDVTHSALSPQRIVKVYRHRRRRIWEITFTDGHQVRTTAIHSFHIAQDWKRAREIGAGDTLC